MYVLATAAFQVLLSSGTTMNKMHKLNLGWQSHVPGLTIYKRILMSWQYYRFFNCRTRHICWAKAYPEYIVRTIQMTGWECLALDPLGPTSQNVSAPLATFLLDWHISFLAHLSDCFNACQLLSDGSLISFSSCTGTSNRCYVNVALGESVQVSNLFLHDRIVYNVIPVYPSLRVFRMQGKENAIVLSDSHLYHIWPSSKRSCSVTDELYSASWTDGSLSSVVA